MWLHVIKVVSVTLMLAITCVAIAQELDHFHTESGGVDSAAWVAQELELSNVDSHSFVSQALTTLYLINTDVTTHEQKLDTGHYEIDFEEADKRTGNDSTEILSMLCRGGN